MVSSGLVTATAASGVESGTNAAEKPLVSFGLLTDVQYADADPEGERHYRASIPKLKAAVADLAKQDLPFSLHLGDFIDRDFASFAAVLPLLKPLGHPVHHLLGNHDYTVADPMKGSVPSTLGMPGDYYVFRNSGVRFAMLDTNDISTYKHTEGSEADRAAEAELAKLRTSKAANAKPWNGMVSAKQLEWLEQELSKADAADEPMIVCGHHPLLPADGHGVWNSGELPPLFRRHRSMRAYLCGHNHAGGEVVVEGLPFITLKSILHQPDVTAYSVIRLYKDRLVIEGRGREKSRTIPLRKIS